jgi:hypothetical protein
MMTKAPNPLLDTNMSEDTQLMLIIAPALNSLFHSRYVIKVGEIGLESSSFRRNQEPEPNTRRRMASEQM